MRSLDAPLPLNGGEAGRGGAGAADDACTRKEPPELDDDRSTTTSIPGPSPIEREGKAFDRRLLRHDPAPICVGLSGGGDSVALLLLTCAWAQPAGRHVLALTVDHGLNPQSGAWTAFARDAAARAGAKFRALAWEGAKPATGLPAAARAARHALLATAARDAGAAVILLGHTADDVDETEHMRARDAPGIGRLREWAPSPAWPQGDGVFLLRPLLGMRRQALRAFLQAQAEPWLDDPANDDVRYARVRARQALGRAPLVTGVDDDAAVAMLASMVQPVEHALSLPRSALLAADKAVARRVLSAAVVCSGETTRPPRSQALDRLLAAIAAGGSPSTLAGARIVTTEDRVIVVQEPAEARRRSPFPLDGGRAGDGGGGEMGELEFGRRLPLSNNKGFANTPSSGLSPIEGKRSYRRFRAATFQIGDEAALRTTSWP